MTNPAFPLMMPSMATKPLVSPADTAGGVVYQSILFLCGGVAVAFAGDALIAVLANPSGGVDWAGLGQCVAGIIMLSVSVAATVNGSRVAVWAVCVADVIFALAKGMALVLLIAMSHPDRAAGAWPVVAAAYFGAVALHLGHVRSVATLPSRIYRRHLRSGQRVTMMLSLLMLACFAVAAISLPATGTCAAPIGAAAFGVMALRSESLIARASSAQLNRPV